jgi:hypothetical protein
VAIWQSSWRSLQQQVYVDKARLFTWILLAGIVEKASHYVYSSASNYVSWFRIVENRKADTQLLMFWIWIILPNTMNTEFDKVGTAYRNGREVRDIRTATSYDNILC